MQFKTNFRQGLAITINSGKHEVRSNISSNTRKMGPIHIGPGWNPIGINNAHDHNLLTELLTDQLYNKFYGEIATELSDIVELINIGDRRAKARIIELIKELKWKDND